MGVFRRHRKLWIRYKDETGEWRNKRTPYAVGQEDLAERAYAATVERVAAAVEVTDGETLTVHRFAERWIKERRARGVASVGDEETRLERHALPMLGDMRLDAVRPRHLRQLVLDLRAAAALAPRTIRYVFKALAGLFRSAVAQELIVATPCVLEPGILPPNVDADPEWRAGAVFTRDELAAIVSAETIVPDRRVWYALLGIAGLRHGEAATLEWRQIEELEPLACIHLPRTKSGVARRVPVHPVLARLLEEWREIWPVLYGRDPEPDDLIVPTRGMQPRERRDCARARARDLAALGLRHRRGHDLRRTLITMARADGARDDLLRVVTHGAPRSILDQYTTYPWADLCRAISGIQLPPVTGLVTGEIRALIDSRKKGCPPTTMAGATLHRWRPRSQSSTERAGEESAAERVGEDPVTALVTGRCRPGR